MIRFDRASKRYPNGREALSAASFEIHDGEMVFLTGRSGAGKSTILKLISLLERPTRGLVMVNGHNTAALSSRKIPAFRRELGVVFQDHRLLPERSVFDNVALPLHAAEIGVTLKEIDKRVRAALDQVGLLDRASSLPLELSVGEQQRVGIARAVVGKPKLIIADEPTGNLDPALSLEVMGVFRRFNDVGVTVVIATHDLDIVKAWNLREIAGGGGPRARHAGAASSSCRSWRRSDDRLGDAPSAVRAVRRGPAGARTARHGVHRAGDRHRADAAHRAGPGHRQRARAPPAISPTPWMSACTSSRTSRWRRPRQLAASLRQRSGVASVTLVSAEEALKSFREQQRLRRGAGCAGPETRCRMRWMSAPTAGATERRADGFPAPVHLRLAGSGTGAGRQRMGADA